jgi:hypothetical protein
MEYGDPMPSVIARLTFYISIIGPIPTMHLSVHIVEDEVSFIGSYSKHGMAFTIVLQYDCDQKIRDRHATL